MNEMTVEQKKEYLSQYLLQQARIRRYDVLTLRNRDKKKIYIKRTEQAKKLRDTIEKDIENVVDKMESEILAQKYLCGMSLEETASMLNYSKRQVERLHNKALENLHPTMEDLNGKGNFTLRP
ncbi:MAG: sigma factor-like helix-turn-helix DNA-binding protein [Acutalibacteraceae bacterium]|nr:sigma factor-like helix-turn-helix DNA-binding protein [Acutalibacteraceae bacterium]